MTPIDIAAELLSEKFLFAREQLYPGIRVVSGGREKIK